MIKETFNSLNTRNNLIFFLVLLVVAIVAPLTIKSNYITSTLVYCLTYAAFGVCWNIIGGYGAQISCCHAAFSAIGAYTSFLCLKHFGISPWMSMFLGMFFSFIVSTIIGVGSFRLRGPFFSIATIAFAELIRVLLLYYSKFTGGAGGLSNTYTGQNVMKLMFDTDKPFYYLMLAALLITVGASYLFSKSKTGYYLSAIKGDEDAATSLGIDAYKVKLKAFQLSAVLTSFIGTLFGFFLSYIDPTSIAGLELSIQMGVVAIIGGLGTLLGPVLGAFVVVPLSEVANNLLGSQAGGSLFLYGFFLVIMIIFRPQGLIGLFSRRSKNK